MKRSFYFKEKEDCMTRLASLTKVISEVSSEERKAMFQLLLQSYNGISWENFNRDLDEKEAVMMLVDSERRTIAGFSTFMLLDIALGGETVKGFFSGDTVVQKEFRRTPLMGVEIGKNFLKCLKRFSRRRIYWILISKGCRTYRVLSIFFREWYPRYDADTPERIKSIMDAFGGLKYPLHYDSAKGLIVFSEGGEALKPGVADARESRMHDPHICFFVERNPHHMRGDELVCAAEVARENFAPSFVHMLKNAEVLDA